MASDALLPFVASSNHAIYYLGHYSGVIMGMSASRIRVTGLCEGKSPGTGEFPAQMACYAEDFSIWWRYHDMPVCVFPVRKDFQYPPWRNMFPEIGFR